jgi:predicted aconitase
MYCDAHIAGASYVILTEADLAYLKMLEAWLGM